MPCQGIKWMEKWRPRWRNDETQAGTFQDIFSSFSLHKQFLPGMRKSTNSCSLETGDLQLCWIKYLLQSPLEADAANRYGFIPPPAPPSPSPSKPQGPGNQFCISSSRPGRLTHKRSSLSQLFPFKAADYLENRWIKQLWKIWQRKRNSPFLHHQKTSPGKNIEAKHNLIILSLLHHIVSLNPLFICLHLLISHKVY